MFKSNLKALAALLLLTTAANSATETTSFIAKIIVTASCTVNATTMDFGTTGLIAANIDATSTINVTCTNTTAYSVGINGGSMGGTIAARKMKVLAADTEAVSYSLFRDSGRSQNWGETLLSGADVVSGVGNGSLQPITVYGRVAAQTAVTPGTYTDTLTVTLTY